MEVRVGQSLASTVDTTAVVVVRAPAGQVGLTCGDAEMVDAKSLAIAPVPRSSVEVGGRHAARQALHRRGGARSKCCAPRPGSGFAGRGRSSDAAEVGQATAGVGLRSG